MGCTSLEAIDSFVAAFWLVVFGDDGWNVAACLIVAVD